MVYLRGLARVSSPLWLDFRSIIRCTGVLFIVDSSFQSDNGQRENF